MLSKIQNMVNELINTNSSNKKLQILKNYDDIKSIIRLIFNPKDKFHISSKHIQKYIKDYPQVLDKTKKPLDVLLTELSDGSLTGHNAIKEVIRFINENSEYTELIYKIIDKKLGIKMGITQINKVFSNLMPTFDVALGEDITKCPNNIQIGTWYLSRKLDGVRIITIINPQNKTVKCYSRDGNQFSSTQKIEEELKDFLNKSNVFTEPMVLDGEGCIIENGQENFIKAVSQFKMKNVAVQTPNYLLFDFLTLKEFKSGLSLRKLSERHNDLKTFVDILGSNIIKMIEQTKYTDETLKLFQEKVENEGWEGLIIRKNIEYKGKRSKDILKIKKFKTAEYIVDSIQSGPIPVLNKTTGLMETIEAMTSVNIKYKGNVVSVGSGFTIDERIKFYKNPEEIIGKTIGIKYFDESINKDGSYSLRFPIYQVFYGDKRNL